MSDSTVLAETTLRGINVFSSTPEQGGGARRWSKKRWHSLLQIVEYV